MSLCSRLLAGLLAISLIAASPVVSAGTSSVPPRSRQELATACAAKVQRLKTETLTRPLLIGQDELTAYLEVNREQYFDSAARNIRVVTGENRLTFSADVDLAKARLQSESILASAFMWIFSGTHHVDAVIEFVSANCEGIYTVRQVKINGIKIPDFLVQSLARQIGRRQNPQMLPGEPFPLPLNLKKCSIISEGLLCVSATARPR